MQSFLIGFNEEHTFFYWNEEAEKAGELPEVPEPIFPTEVVEEHAKLWSVFPPGLHAPQLTSHTTQTIRLIDLEEIFILLLLQNFINPRVFFFLYVHCLVKDRDSILPEIIPVNLSSSCHIAVGILFVHAHASV